MFGEFLQKTSYEIEFERLGIRTVIEPLSEDELEECRRMRGVDGARYALYLACPALHEEGERLYKEGRLFSPLDITMAISAADANGAYRYIKEISGMGESRVTLYENDRPAFGADEIFDEISRNMAENDGESHITEDFDDFSEAAPDGVANRTENRRNMSQYAPVGKIVAETDENEWDMEKIAEVLAYKLRMAASNM